VLELAAVALVKTIRHQKEVGQRDERRRTALIKSSIPEIKNVTYPRQQADQTPTGWELAEAFLATYIFLGLLVMAGLYA
jgi:hypothetical protein